jgi:PTS system fructose-specific IIA component
MKAKPRRQEDGMELMSEALVLLDRDCSTKEEVVNAIADAMEADGRLIDRDGYVRDVFKREEEFSTSIGFGVATPHAKSDTVRVASLAYMRLVHPMTWGEDEVDTIFQIAVPMADAGERHLQILASVSRHLIHEEFRAKLAAAKTPAEVIALMDE